MVLRALGLLNYLNPSPTSSETTWAVLHTLQGILRDENGANLATKALLGLK